MIIHNVTQGSSEWHEARRGKFTASTFGDLFAAKTTKAWNNLINQVVFERLTGEIPESFTNGWMERGKELESEAIESYELQTFNKVKVVGFIELSEWIGCSPDGLIDEDGIVSIKCPKFSTLIDYHLSGKIPPEYLWQIQGELYITGRKWTDLYVYHPKIKSLIKHVERDEKNFEELKSKLDEVINEAKNRISKINLIS